MKYELPVPIHEENKWTALLVCSVVFLFGYIIPNRYHFITPIYLQMTAVDLAVPLVPWTIFIYQSEYVYFFIAYALIRGEDTRNRYFYSFLTVQAVSMAFFVFWPTAFPRHAYPLPVDINPWVRQAFAVLHLLDEPSNSFPSLHVSACFVTAFAFYRESKVKLAFFLLWSVAISISTLTIKQHYFMDIVGGLVLAMASSWFFVTKARYQAPGALAGP